jgi:hypothetical protein
MNNVNRSIPYILLLILILVAASCRVRKDLTVPKEGTLVPTVRLWEQVRDQNIGFDWYEARAEVEVTFGEMTLGGTADIRIRKDSVIFMRIKKFGFEMARVLITPDSLFALNRLQASYVVSSIDSLQRAAGVPFGFTHLQEVLAGNYLVENQRPAGSIPMDEGYMLSTTDGELDVNYRLDPGLQVQQVSFSDGLGRSAEMELGDRRPAGDFLVPYRRDYYYPGKDNAEYILRFRLEKMEIDQPKNIRFEIPPGYTRL